MILKQRRKGVFINTLFFRTEHKVSARRQAPVEDGDYERRI